MKKTKTKIKFEIEVDYSLNMDYYPDASNIAEAIEMETGQLIDPGNLPIVLDLISGGPTKVKAVRVEVDV